MINRVCVGNTMIKTKQDTKIKSNTKQKEKNISTNRAYNQDRIDIRSNQKTSGTSKFLIYSNYKKSNTTDVQTLKEQTEWATDNQRKLVERLFKKQNGTIKWIRTSAKVASGKAIEEMREAVSENGQYGVKAVSSGIVQFAIAYAGHDPEKLQAMRKAIDMGYAEAEKIFGGELPKICEKTYDEIMRKLDDWENETNEVVC